MGLNQKPHLVLIDVQCGFLSPVWGKRNNPEAESTIAKLLESWRERHWPITHVQHLSTSSTSPLRPGQPGVEFMSFVKPRPGETIIQKSVNSAFIATELEGQLRRESAHTLVFAGFVTDHCVSTTVRMAANLGFAPVVISDATATFERELNGKLYDAQAVHEVALASLAGEFSDVMDFRRLSQDWLKD